MAVVGHIARAHGIRGQVIVDPETDFLEERFQPEAELFAGVGGGAWRTLTITTARFHLGRPVIGLKGVDDMNAASALAGLELRVPVEQLAALPDGTFYRHDLVGCLVETTSGEPVGEVAKVEGTLGDSRLVINVPNGEVLIPLVTAICKAIDPVGKRIVIAPPEGLLELNTRVAERKS